MSKVVLNDVSSLANTQSAKQVLNDNFARIEAAFDNTLSRNGQLPNQMEADLDLNSNDILNADVIDASEYRINGVPLEQLVSFGDVKYEIFDGDGTTDEFPLQFPPGSVGNLEVSISGVVQRPGLDYNLEGTTQLVFTVPPPAGTDNILVVYAVALQQSSSDANSTRFIQAGVGAVTRTMQDKGREVVSTFDFGAVADSLTDTSAAVQAALNTGKDVYLSQGGHVVTGLTTTAHGQRIYGPGKLIKKAGVDGVTLTVAHDYCIVEGVEFDGTNPQPSLTFVNDIIRITGDYNKIRGNTVNGSKGGGIVIASAKGNIVSYNHVFNTDDNNILVADVGADDNIISHNYCDGTTEQNNIFLTASGNSSPTANFIYRNIVQGNICKNAADTGIESGIHTVGTIIEGNNVYNSFNPEILLRDSKECIVRGNVCEAGPNAHPTQHDGIAIVNQTESNWNYDAIISGNRIYGKITRSGVHIGDGNVILVEGNMIEESFAAVNPDGTGLVASGVLLAAGVEDVSIRDNQVKRVLTGIDGNFPAVPLAHMRLTVEGNDLFGVGTGISLFDCDLVNSRVVGNRITQVRTTAINVSSSSGGNTSIIARNQFNLAGWVGPTPSKLSFEDLDALGYMTGEGIQRLLVPENQFDLTGILSGDANSTGIVMIEFEDNSQTLVASMFRTATIKLGGSTDMLDSSGAAGFAGWSLFYNAGQLILQRRGANTGSGARFFRVNIVSAGNQF